MRIVIILCLAILMGFDAAGTEHIWTKTKLKQISSLRGISVFNKDVVWVTGNNGTVAKTEDGAHWQLVNIPQSETLDFRDVEVLSISEVLVMSAGEGEKSAIFKTTDSGASWQKVQANNLEKGFYDGFAFWNDKEGILAGDPIDGKLFLMKTANGGDSWTRINPDLLPPMTEGEVGGFAASGSHVTVLGNSVWIGTGGSVARIFYSHDRGESWRVSKTPIIQGESSQGIFSIDFFDENNGVAVGGDYTQETEAEFTVIVTEDGGENWRLANDFPVYQSSVRYLLKDVLVSVGPAASYISRNAGKNWVKLKGDGYHTLSRTGGSVWAAGRESRIGNLSQD